MACEIEKRAWDTAKLARETAQANLAVAQQTYNVALATEMIAKQTYEICMSMPHAMAKENLRGLTWEQWRDKLIDCGLEYAKEMEAMNKMKPK